MPSGRLLERPFPEKVCSPGLLCHDFFLQHFPSVAFLPLVRHLPMCTRGFSFIRHKARSADLEESSNSVTLASSTRKLGNSMQDSPLVLTNQRPYNSLTLRIHPFALCVRALLEQVLSRKKRKEGKHGRGKGVREKQEGLEGQPVTKKRFSEILNSPVSFICKKEG